jgi:hypothetical protein
VYDLTRLNARLPDSIPFLEFDSVTKVQNGSIEEPMIAPKTGNRLFLWGAIILVLLALLYFTVKLTREVNKKSAAENGR